MAMNKKIKALGFIEVIIAIVVVGIMSAVFLTMAGRAMRELVQIERIEAMKRVAKDGVVIAQEVANKQKNALPTEELFPTEIMSCYIPVKDGSGDYFMEKDIEGNFIAENITEDLTLRDWAIENALYDNFNGDDTDDHYFLVMCITDIDDSGTRWANVYFWVGDRNVAGQITNDRDLKDFKYYAIIDL